MDELYKTGVKDKGDNSKDWGRVARYLPLKVKG